MDKKAYICYRKIAAIMPVIFLNMLLSSATSKNNNAASVERLIYLQTRQTAQSVWSEIFFYFPETQQNLTTHIKYHICLLNDSAYNTQML
jgi:hypothetical protein